MQTAMAPRAQARTFLIHMFGSGLDGDDCFVVERYDSRQVPCHAAVRAQPFAGPTTLSRSA